MVGATSSEGILVAIKLRDQLINAYTRPRSIRLIQSQLIHHMSFVIALTPRGIDFVWVGMTFRSYSAFSEADTSRDC